MITLAIVLTASLLSTQQTPVPEPAQPQSTSLSPKDPFATSVEGIVQALKADNGVARAYLLRKPTDDGSLVFVLVPIFDKKYPQEAIKAAYNVFEQNMPQEAKLELFLVPKRDYKKYFAQFEPIYVRP